MFFAQNIKWQQCSRLSYEVSEGIPCPCKSILDVNYLFPHKYNIWISDMSTFKNNCRETPKYKRHNHRTLLLESSWIQNWEVKGSQCIEDCQGSLGEGS